MVQKVTISQIREAAHAQLAEDYASARQVMVKRLEALDGMTAEKLAKHCLRFDRSVESNCAVARAALAVTDEQMRSPWFVSDFVAQDALRAAATFIPNLSLSEPYEIMYPFRMFIAR